MAISNVDELAAEVESTLDEIEFPNGTVERLARYAAARLRTCAEDKDALKWHAQVLACVRLCGEKPPADDDEDARTAAILATRGVG